MRYRQVIEFTGRSLDDVFRLPCVQAVEKNSTNTTGGVKPSVFLLIVTEEVPYVIAQPGHLLCEDYDGRWHVRTPEQLKAEKEQ